MVFSVCSGNQRAKVEATTSAQAADIFVDTRPIHKSVRLSEVISVSNVMKETFFLTRNVISGLQERPKLMVV